MYYFSVHLLYASIVGCAAWVLTSVRGASATTKYWIWIVTVFNFVVPVGAGIDKLWAPHLAWAAPLGANGGPVWDMTGPRTCPDMDNGRTYHASAIDVAFAQRASRGSSPCRPRRS